jgi:hypothetical protein
MAFTERLALLIDAKAGGAISELNKLNAEINMVNRTQTQATGITGMFDKGLQKIGIQSSNTAALLKAGVAAAATTAAYAMVRFGSDAVKATTEWADSVRTVQRSTGLSAENASRLSAVFDDYGINVDSAASSLNRFARNLSEGNGELTKYGIEVVRSKDGTLDYQRTLMNVAEAYQSAGSQADRAALLNDAFGKSGKDLIPILEGGRAGIKAMFDAVPDKQILSQEQIDNAQAYKLAMDNLQDVMLELKLTLGNAVVPILTDLANGFATVSRMAMSLDSLVPGLTEHLMKFGFLVAGIPLPLFGSSVDNAKQKLETMIQSLDPATRAQLEHSKKTFDSVEAVQAYVDKLQYKNQETQYEVQLQKQANDEIQANIDLIYKRINAELGLEGAQINVTTAIQNMDTVLADSTKTELERQKAVLEGKQAIDRMVDAIRAQGVASGDAAGNIQGQIDSLMFLKGTLDPSSPLIVFLDSYIDKLKNQVPKSVNTYVDVNFVARWTDPDMPPPGDWPGGADGDPNTPYPMAKGGIVTRPTNALIGEAGPEAVIPLGKGAGMGTTIQLVVDGRVLTQIVRDDLIRIGRANGSALGRYA